MIKKIFRLSFFNALGNYQRNISLIGGVFSSALIVSIFYGYISATKNEIEGEYKYKNLFGDFIIENPNFFEPNSDQKIEDTLISQSQQKLIDEYLEKKSSIIQANIKTLVVNGVIESLTEDQFIQVFAYDTEQALKLKSKHWKWTATHGEMLEYSKTENAITIGRTLAGKIGCIAENPLQKFKDYDGFIPEERRFSCKNSDIKISTHTISGQINTANLKVVGLVSGGIKEADETLGFMSLDSGQKVLNTKYISYYSISAYKKSDIQSTIQDMNKYFTDLNLNIRAIEWKKHPYVGQFYIGTMNFFNMLVNFIFIIMITLSFICVFISLLNNMKSRTSEIVTLKQLGFNKKHIFITYLFEYLSLIFFATTFAYIGHLIAQTSIKFLRIEYTAGILIEPSILKINSSIIPLTTYFFIMLIFVGFLLNRMLRDLAKS